MKNFTNFLKQSKFDLCDTFHDEFDEFHFPLEKLSYSEQKVCTTSWVDNILTSKDVSKLLCIMIEVYTQDHKTSWRDESEIKIFVKETLPTPNEATNDVKESFTLLLLMLYFRVQYKSSVALQNKTKRIAHSAAQLFIKELNDLKQQPKEITQQQQKEITQTTFKISDWKRPVMLTL
ncbi:hypothetical protein AVEN_167255-1 [Araneus ventricosus]|uniref:Uncharacterized protein n=1 Tax=Araneus ventricosus TaxID=182803 RepID=A0A4Y2HFY6_ARAVE|nr:hypothetical protein AVEN_167255-1 [Araneus ventricosus]